MHRWLWGRQVLCRSAGSPSCQRLLSVLQTSARRTPCLFNITDVSSCQDWGNFLSQHLFQCLVTLPTSNYRNHGEAMYYCFSHSHSQSPNYQQCTREATASTKCSRCVPDGCLPGVGNDHGSSCRMYAKGRCLSSAGSDVCQCSTPGTYQSDKYLTFTGNYAGCEGQASAFLWGWTSCQRLLGALQTSAR